MRRRSFLAVAAASTITKASAAPLGSLPDFLAGYPAPILDFDFVNGIYRQDAIGYNTVVSNFITTSRASTAYSDDQSGTWTSFGNNVPRITNKGLLTEEAQTNSLPNNSMQGAAAGSPGTMPTGWLGTATGLTRTVVGTGTQNGIPYIDIRFNGTTGATFGSIAFVGNTTIAASNGQSWRDSAFLALVGGSWSNVTSINLNVQQNDSGGVFLSNLSSSLGTGNVTSSLTRFNFTTTLNNASVAFIASTILLTWSNGVAVDFTLRIGWPQITNDTILLSPINTTAGAVTRSFDNVTLTTLFPYNSSGLTIVVYTSGREVGTTGHVVSFDDGAPNTERIGIFASNVSVGGFARSGGVSAGSLTPSNTLSSALVPFKAAVAVKANEQKSILNGGTVAYSASPVGMPSPTTFRFGVGFDAASNFYDGYLQRLLVFSTYLNDASMQAVTK